MDSYGEDDGDGEYAELLRKGVGLVRTMGDMVPFRGRATMTYIEAWNIMNTLSVPKYDIKYEPGRDDHMTLTVKCTTPPATVRLLYDDEGVHKQVKKITFDMALMSAQLVVTLVMALLRDGDDVVELNRLRRNVMDKLRDIDQLVLRADPALVMVGRRAENEAADDDPYVDDDAYAGALTVEYSDSIDADVLMKGMLADNDTLTAPARAHTDVDVFRNLLGSATETVKTHADVVSDLSKILVELGAAASDGGAHGDLFERAAALLVKKVDTEGSPPETVRSRLDNNAREQRLVELRGLFSAQLGLLEVVANIAAAAMSMKANDDADVLSLLVPSDFRTRKDEISLLLDAYKIPDGSRTVAFPHASRAALEMSRMPKITVTCSGSGSPCSAGMAELDPAGPMDVGEFRRLTSGTLAGTTEQDVLIYLTAVSTKTQELARDESKRLLLYLLCRNENRRIINDKLVSSRLLTFVKVNHIELDPKAFKLTKSLFSEVRSDKLLGGGGGSRLLEVKHVAHAKKYLFGPFTSVIPKNVPREDTGRDWVEKRGLAEAIAKGSDVVILGYGSSGAGKTSFLVAMTGGSQQLKEPPPKEKLKGVFSYIIKGICARLRVSQFTVKVHQAMNRDGLGQSATATGSCEDDDTCIVQTGKVQTYTLGGSTASDDATIAKLEAFLKVNVTQSAYRETWPTANNPESSRTHCIVRVEFGANESKFGRVLLGDLAGYENHFDCRMSSMAGFNLMAYMNLYNSAEAARKLAPQSIWMIEKAKQDRDSSGGGGGDGGVVHAAFNKAQRPNGDLSAAKRKNAQLPALIDEFKKEYGITGDLNDEQYAAAAHTRIKAAYQFDENNKQVAKYEMTAFDNFDTQEPHAMFSADNQVALDMARAIDSLPAVLAGEQDQLRAPRKDGDQSELDKKFANVLSKYKFDVLDADVLKDLATIAHGPSGSDMYANVDVRPVEFLREMSEIRSGLQHYASVNQPEVMAFNKLRELLRTEKESALLATMTDTSKALTQWFLKVSQGTGDSKAAMNRNHGFSIDLSTSQTTHKFFKKLQDVRTELERIVKAAPGTLQTEMMKLIPPDFSIPDFRKTTSMSTIYSALFKNSVNGAFKTTEDRFVDVYASLSSAGSHVLVFAGEVTWTSVISAMFDSDSAQHASAVKRAADENTEAPQRITTKKLIAYKHTDGKHYVGQAMLDLFNGTPKIGEIDLNMCKARGKSYFPNGVYFVLRMLTDESFVSRSEFPILSGITGKLLRYAYTKQGFPKPDLKDGSNPATNTTDVICDRFDKAAKAAMMVYANLWRLKTELKAQALLLSQHCLDREVEASYIIDTLQRLSSFIRTSIFDRTNISFPPIHASCLGPMLASKRDSDELSQGPTAADRAVKAESLRWLGLGAEGLRGDFMFCIAAVVNIAPIRVDQQNSLVKYVDVSDLKAAIYGRDFAALLVALEDLIGWASSTKAQTTKANAKQGGQKQPQFGRLNMQNMEVLKSGVEIDANPTPDWGGKIDWDKLETPSKLMAPLRAAVLQARTKLLSGGNDGGTTRVLTESARVAGAIKGGMMRVEVDGVAYDAKSLYEVARKLCTYIDTDNASTSLGVLEFMDSMAKFGKTNTVCHTEANDASGGELTLDHAAPELPESLLDDGDSD